MAATGRPGARLERLLAKDACRHSLQFGAACVPALAVALLVTLKPSVLLDPAFYFVYAFLQAAIFLLVIRFLDLYEREPLAALAIVALWGALAATAISAVGNGIVFGVLNEDLALALGPDLRAPRRGDGKGLALVAAFALSTWASRRYGWLEFEGVTDGIVYGAAVGLGFALVEDLFYFLFSGESARRDSTSSSLVLTSSGRRCSDIPSRPPHSERDLASRHGVARGRAGSAGRC